MCSGVPRCCGPPCSRTTCRLAGVRPPMKHYAWLLFRYHGLQIALSYLFVSYSVTEVTSYNTVITSHCVRCCILVRTCAWNMRWGDALGKLSPLTHRSPQISVETSFNIEVRYVQSSFLCKTFHRVCSNWISGKGKFVPLYTKYRVIKTYGGVKTKLHAFLILALLKVAYELLTFRIRKVPG